MASKARQQPIIINKMTKLPIDLAKHARSYDWFAALLQLEVHNSAVKRIGDVGLPAEEYIRLGQRPMVGFVAETVAGFDKSAAKEDGPIWLMQHFFGVFGSNGPLPLHLTEYAIEREKYQDDLVFTRFVNLFHHRMLALFYRNWRMARAVADFPDDQCTKLNFKTRLHLLTGIADDKEAYRNVESIQQTFTGLIAGRTRSVETLVHVLEHFTGTHVQVDAIVPIWLTKDQDQYSLLGVSASLLGQDCQLGGRVLSVQSQINITVGPLKVDAYSALLPNTDGGKALCVLVHRMVGHSISSTIQLLAESEQPLSLRLGRTYLGYDSWLGLEGFRLTRRGCLIYPEKVVSPN